MKEHYLIIPYLYLDNDLDEFIEISERKVKISINTSEKELKTLAEKIKKDASEEDPHEITLIKVFKITKIMEI